VHRRVHAFRRAYRTCIDIVYADRQYLWTAQMYSVFYYDSIRTKVAVYRYFYMNRTV
jgi:hypothetical protein